ncbi:MAG: VanZ family protein [Candidatus Scalindua sp.]
MLRVLLWALVAVYTFVLPYFIVIYNAIVKHFSVAIAGKVPIAIIIVMGVVFFIAVLALKKDIKALILLIPCTIIVWILVSLEPNQNKYIHIPEYVVMSWILFEALSIDYKGKGIFCLVFICAASLGIVDEMMQGILPGRSYGWRDIIMNSAATVIGIFTLAGLRTTPAGGWTWIGRIKQCKKALGIIVFGTAGAALMCISLFNVKAHGTFKGVYPGWLLGWSGLFVVTGSVVILFPGYFYMPYRTASDTGSYPSDQLVTARLWILCPLVILIIMHGLVVLTVAKGLTFL